MKTLRHSVIVLILLAVAVAAPASADEQKTIFYNVTTDEAWAAGMALGQATKALDVDILNSHVLPPCKFRERAWRLACPIPWQVFILSS